MSRALPLLIVLLLAACGRAPTRPDPPPPGNSGAAPPASRAASEGRAARGARPDRPGEYTAGGLYRPGVSDSGPSVPPDISGLVEPVPRNEPRARYGNRTPYTVLGRSYHVMTNARNYRERGIASWYGEKFHGRATSSFEPYDMYAFTAAHKTLPLPTYARVTNLENGRSVVVRVNDRGPFHADRLIDLSYAAAIKLGIHVKGTARVEVEALVGAGEEPGGGHAVTTSASAAPSTTAAAVAWLQVASFSDKANARRLAEQLQQADLDRVKIRRARVRGERVYRVRIGPFEARRLAEDVAAQVRALGLGHPSIVAE